MQYADKDKTAVTLTRADGKTWTVPRGHRLWEEFGIAAAETQGSIKDAPDEHTYLVGTGGSGGTDAV